MRKPNKNKGVPLSAAHCEALSKAQGSTRRKMNRNNATGHNNVCMLGKKFRVDVAGAYIGLRGTIEEALTLRDEARKRLLPE